MVMRAWTLRPLVFDCLAVSGQCGWPLYSSGLTTLPSARRPGEVGLTFTSGIAASSWRRGEIDFLAFGDPHVGLLPVAPPPDHLAEAARLATHVRYRDRIDLDLEHQLDRGLDLRLGGVIGDAEDVVAVLLVGSHTLVVDAARKADSNQLRDL